MKSRNNEGHALGSFSGLGGGTWNSEDNGASGGIPTKGGMNEAAAVIVTVILQLEEHA